MRLSPRSHLCVRPDDEDRLARALASGADCLWLDLEGLSLKGRQDACEWVRTHLRAGRQSKRPSLYFRITGLAEADVELDAVMPALPDGIVLPGARHGADIQHLGAKLAVREADQGLADGSTRIIALAAQIPAALFQMGTYVGSSRRLAGLAFMPDALAAAIGAEAPAPGRASGPAFELASSLTLLAAKAAGVAAIAGANRTRDDYMRADCETARRQGFTAKMTFEPDDVGLINEVFALKPERT